MHSSSKTWMSAGQMRKKNFARLNDYRRRFCPNSYAWPIDFEIEQHRIDVNQALLKQEKKKMERILQERQQRTGPPVIIKLALGGKTFGDNYSYILAKKTVFTHEYLSNRTHEDFNGRYSKDFLRTHKDIADWPARAESKYEGDDRISTDVLHGRCLGAPRISGNETVNWMQRTIIPSYRLEDFYYPVPGEVDIFMQSHYIAGIEFEDEEGEEILGKAMMEMLDE